MKVWRKNDKKALFTRQEAQQGAPIMPFQRPHSQKILPDNTSLSHHLHLYLKGTAACLAS